jgi:hypothetical protein
VVRVALTTFITLGGRQAHDNSGRDDNSFLTLTFPMINLRVVHSSHNWTRTSQVAPSDRAPFRAAPTALGSSWEDFPALPDWADVWRSALRASALAILTGVYFSQLAADESKNRKAQGLKPKVFSVVYGTTKVVP